MTGAEHYRKAEQLLTTAAHPDTGPESARWYQAQAQVHATLALAAATVDVGVGGPPMTAKKSEDWREVTR